MSYLSEPREAPFSISANRVSSRLGHPLRDAWSGFVNRRTSRACIGAHAGEDCPEKNAGTTGLLTASDIAGLRLNADWVVLSSCNTRQDRLTIKRPFRLARAFFLGTRADGVPLAGSFEAAVALTIGAIRRQAELSIGRAEPSGGRCWRWSIKVASRRGRPIKRSFVVVGDGITGISAAAGKRRAMSGLLLATSKVGDGASAATRVRG